MIVFVLDSRHQAAALRTKACLDRWHPGRRAVFIESDCAQVINEEIASGTDAFFMTLYAGETFAPAFVRSLEERAERLPGKAAGIMLQQDGGDAVLKDAASDIPRGPVLWRTEAVQSSVPSGFASRKELPFESYLLQEMFFRLSPRWVWDVMKTGDWRPYQPSLPGWRQPEKERAYVYPLIAAPERTPSAAVRPKVTVVLCTYNDGEYVHWAIRSVLAQTSPHWELIVVNDASDDDTRSLLESVSGPNIRIIHHDVNAGKSACLNRALSLAQGEWLLELDADDWLATDCVEKLLEHAASKPDAGALYADHAEWMEIPGRQPVYKKAARSMPVFEAEAMLSNAFPLAPRFYRVQALRALGGWLTTDPFEGRLYEDFQMLLRISLGHPVDYVQMPLYHRRLRGGSITHRMEGRYETWKTWLRQAVPEARRGG